MVAIVEITEEWESLCFIVFWSVFKTNDVKPTIEKFLTRFFIILHTGTNDYKIKCQSWRDYYSIVDVAVSCKENGSEVPVSAILPRRDKLNGKGTIVNEKTKELCLEKSIYFLEHRNFNRKYHLNDSKLHSNKKGLGILAFSFLKYFNNKWLVYNVDRNLNSEKKKSKNEIVNKNLCDSATMSNNRNKVDKSHSDDCDSGSTDSSTSDSRANGKFTVSEHLKK